MRIPRRGVIAQRKDGYVWAIYSVVYGVDESAGGTGGSVRLSSSRYKMAAKAYTVSEDGTVSLTDSTRTTAANLAVGDYLVNVSTSNNTSTTGTTLYKVTGTSSSGSYVTVSYTAYTPSLCAKGVDTGQRVESETADYPVDGLHTDGQWYTLIRGYATVYVWDVFTIITTYGYKESTTQSGGMIGTVIEVNTSGIMYASAYTFNTSNGYYTLTSPRYDSSNGSASGNYWMPGSSETSQTMYHGANSLNTSRIEAGTKYTSSRDTSLTTYGKGSATGESVESVSSTAYPQDGVQGDYWYTYSHSYEGWIDNT